MRRIRFHRQVAVLVALLAAVIALFVHVGITAQTLLTPAVVLAPITFSLNQVGMNLVAYVPLSVRPPFDCGDTVTIAGSTGTVRRFGLLHVILAGTEGESISIPNSMTLSSPYVVKRKDAAHDH